MLTLPEKNCSYQLSYKMQHAFGLFFFLLYCLEESCDMMVKVLDCGLKVSKFKLQLHYYIHFQTNTIVKVMYVPPYPSSVTFVLQG